MQLPEDFLHRLFYLVPLKLRIPGHAAVARFKGSETDVQGVVCTAFET
jgi:hypothetical protein